MKKKVKATKYNGQALRRGETLVRILHRGEPDEVVVVRAKDVPQEAHFKPEKPIGPRDTKGFKRITRKFPKIS